MSLSPRLEPDMRAKTETGFVFELTLLLFICAAAVGIWFVSRQPDANRSTYLVVVGLPVSAASLFAFSCFLVPDLVAPRRVVFPLPVTLPLVYSLLIIVSVVLWTTNGSSIVATDPTLNRAMLWSQPLPLGMTVALQCLVLSVVALKK